MYENCGVKNCMKEKDHRSYRRNFCSCEKETLKKMPSQHLLVITRMLGKYVASYNCIAG